MTKYNETELYSHIDFEGMTKVYYKLLGNNKYININHANSVISIEDKEKIEEIYNYLDKDIEENFKSMISKPKLLFLSSFKKNNMFKVLSAWQSFLYIKDTRTPEQLIENVEKGWKVENFVYDKSLEYGFKCIMAAKDRDRIPSLFNFDSTPDLRINNIPVEVQYGENNFFKQNKLDSVLKSNSFLIFYDPTIKKFHLFTQNELRKINEGQVVTSYKYKEGKNFNKSDYTYGTLEKELRKCFISSKKKNTTVKPK